MKDIVATHGHFMINGRMLPCVGIFLLLWNVLRVVVDVVEVVLNPLDGR